MFCISNLNTSVRRKINLKGYFCTNNQLNSNIIMISYIRGVVTLTLQFMNDFS